LSEPVRRKTRTVGPSREPWTPYIPSKSEAFAVKAVVSGKADEEQQKVFMAFFNRLSGVGDLEFRPESERASAFASGKRFVGMQLHRIANLSSEYIKTLDP